MFDLIALILLFGSTWVAKSSLEYLYISASLLLVNLKGFALFALANDEGNELVRK
jgi:hypothetical protein